MGAFPNTLLIGAAKAGTTSLAADLAAHPGIWMYPTKETHFFSYDYAKGPDYYRSLFRPKGEPIVMEASPEYTEAGRAGEIAGRIAATLGRDLRLIYMVRDPLDRIGSAYVQEVANGRPTLPFSAAIRSWALEEGSRYGANYAAYAREFGEKRIHVVFLEDYRTDRRGVIEALCAFLDLPAPGSALRGSRPLNARGEKVVDPGWLKRARALPGANALRGALPGPAKARIKRWVLPPVAARPDWTPDLRAQLRDRLRGEALSFLADHGKAPDFWPTTAPEQAVA